MNFVINDLNDSKLLKLFFDSFKDKSKISECADSVDYNTFKELNRDIRQELVMHMSAPGANKMFEQSIIKSNK